MIRIEMNRLKHTVVLELPTDYEHVLVSLWKLGLDRDPVKYTLRELKVVFHYDTSEEHQMIRMIKSSDTLMFALISLHQMIAPPYSIANVLREKISSGCYNTADEFYADMEKMVFRPSTCQSSFFFPISAELVDKKGIVKKVGDDVLLKYEYMVVDALVRTASQSLYWKTELFSDVEGAYEKLLSAVWMVERIEDTLYGHVSLVHTEPFTEEEIADLTEKIEMINNDVESYATIVDWLYNMDSALNLAPGIDLSCLWRHAESYSLKAVSSLMYSAFCGNKDAYDAYLKDNRPAILGYLKRKTKSHTIKVEGGCIKVEYILRASEKKRGNEASVSRLKDICRMLPVFDKYCSDAISPHINLLDGLTIPNDAHKEMPRRNLVITFHQEFNSLWLKTIESNYEFDTVYAWVDYWLQVRQCACELLKACCLCMHRTLEGKKANSAASSFSLFYMRYNKLLTAPLSYPREHRPFEEKLTLPEQLRKEKGHYFDGIQNFSNQFIQFVKREKNSDNLALYNLRSAWAALPNMQRFFEHLELEDKLRATHNELCMIEERILMDTYMCCEYYLSHTPDPRFQKYDIKAYFESSKKAEIADVNSSLGALTTVGAVFPKKVYRENIFACYPILLRDFDVTDETMMQAFLLQSIAFADASYDYLVMLIADGEGEIIPNALKFPKRTFQYIQAELNGEPSKYLEEFTSPFPVEVTSDMLECFDEEYKLQQLGSNRQWLGQIGDIGEELWVYSKTRELLVDEADRQYLADSLATVKTKIEKILGLLGTSADSKIGSLIRDSCSEVYSGEVFDDEKYNELIDCIQAMSVNIN